MKNLKRYLLAATACVLSLFMLVACGATGKMEASYDRMDAPQTSDYGMYSTGVYDTTDSLYAEKMDSVPSGEQQNDGVSTGRKLIKNVTIRLETKEFDAFNAELDARIAAFGGYVQSSSVDGGGYYSKNNRRYATVTARIPAENLDTFISGVSEIANVTSKSENTNDVTLSYYDMESHVKALRSEYDTLLGILEKCTELKDVISVQSRITEVLYQIESYQSKLNNYDNLVAYSTVTMNISEVERETVVNPETMGERIRAGFSETVADISKGFEDFTVAFVVNLPYLLIWGAVFAVAATVIRSFVRRQRRRIAEKRVKTSSASDESSEK